MDATGCQVFVGVMPIRLPVNLPRTLALPLARAGALHFYTVLQQNDHRVYFDFLPERPEDPSTAIRALCGLEIQGVVQERSLRRRPSKSCWLVGKVEAPKGLESARKFNDSWDKELVLFQHDCRHYTNALVSHLTGQTNVTDLIAELRNQEKDSVQWFVDYQ